MVEAIFGKNQFEVYFEFWASFQSVTKEVWVYDLYSNQPPGGDHNISVFGEL